MPVDIGALRSEREMAKTGTRQRVRYFTENEFGIGIDVHVEIEDEDFYVAARNALVSEVQGGGGLLEEHKRLRAERDDLVRQVELLTKLGERAQAHAVAAYKRVIQLQAEVDRLLVAALSIAANGRGLQ